MHANRIFCLATVAAIVASCAPAPQSSGPVVIPQIAGRVAGPPQSCVPIQPSTSMHLENRNAFVYNLGSVVWVSSTNCPASFDDLPVFHPTGSSHCRGDIVQMVDRSTHMPGPSCILGDFVPYRRP
jgi:hypothetical protein